MLLGKEQRLAVLDMEVGAVVGQSATLPFVIYRCTDLLRSFLPCLVKTSRACEMCQKGA